MKTHLIFLAPLLFCLSDRPSPSPQVESLDSQLQFQAEEDAPDNYTMNAANIHDRIIFIGDDDQCARCDVQISLILLHGSFAHITS